MFESEGSKVEGGGVTFVERSSTNAPTKDDSPTQKYRKMLQAGVPPMAVRHKMVADGLLESEIGLTFEPEDGNGEGSSDAAVAQSSTSESAKDDGPTQKYRKMLQAGVPPMAVRHKMVADGLPETEIESIFEPENKPGKSSIDESAENGELVHKYRAMLKAGVPPQAVEHKMVQDGVDKNLIGGVVGGDRVDSLARHAALSASKLMTLHWTPLGLSKKDLGKSVWGSGEAWTVPSLEMARLEELFTKKTAIKSGKFAKSVSDGNLCQIQIKKKVSVLDNARVQNLAIGLRNFRSIDPASIGPSLNSLSSNAFTLEELPRLSEMIPTEAEIKAVQAHARRLEIQSCEFQADEGVRSDGEASVRNEYRLESPEAFCLGFLEVQRPRTKLNVLTFMKTFSVAAIELLEKLNLLRRSIDQIEKSTKLAQLLCKILTVGNVMNEGTAKGGARGITVDSLLKLTQTKSTCKSMNFLDFVVDSLLKADDEETRSILTFAEDLPDLGGASKMPLGELCAQVAQLQADLLEAECELTLLRKDDAERATMHLGHRGPGSDAVEAGALRANGQTVLEIVSPANFDPRANLMTALKARAGPAPHDVAGLKPSDPRANLLAAIKAKAPKAEACNGGNRAPCEAADSKSSDPRANLLAAIKAKAPKTEACEGGGPAPRVAADLKPSDPRASLLAAIKAKAPKAEACNGGNPAPREAADLKPSDSRANLLAAIKAKAPKANECIGGNLSPQAAASRRPSAALGKTADALERCVKVASVRVQEVEAATSELRRRSNGLAAFFGEREQDATHIISCLSAFAAMTRECEMKLKKAR
jgi:hypothetical protein